MWTSNIQRHGKAKEIMRDVIIVIVQMWRLKNDLVAPYSSSASQRHGHPIYKKGFGQCFPLPFGS